MSFINHRISLSTMSSTSVTSTSGQSIDVVAASSTATESEKRKVKDLDSSVISKKKKAPISASSSSSSSANDNTKKSSKRILTEQISNLPVFQYEQELVAAVRKHATTIVVGETGSGKSTQIPQILLDNGIIPSGKCVVCTQPRRVAAVTIAQKVASERAVSVGQEVGYSIRFEDKSSIKTQIKYATDGVLLRECMSDPMLSKYSVVILDEAHERSLQTDILMGLLKQLQERRPDIRVIIMSATLQVELFTSFFKDTTAVIIPGRQFPVSILYAATPESDYIDAALLTCLQIHEEEELGGVLVFLPGQEDIESLQQLLLEHLPTLKKAGNETNKPLLGSNKVSIVSKSNPEIVTTTTKDEDGSLVVSVEDVKDYEIRPLYAAMPPEEQLKVFEPSKEGVRKFILSTNIAETSVTISGVKYVVDTGYVKTRLVNPHTGIEMLKIMPVSKSQANQRAGRAGRECAGKSFRIYTESTYEDLEEASVPEIQRMNISQVLLQLKVMGIKSPMSFPFLSPPSSVVLRNGLEMLFLLGAVDRQQELTPHGRNMASLPLNPNFAHLLLKSIDLKCVSEALTAVSLLSAENVFLQPHREEEKKAAAQAHRNFATKDGDLPTLINIYQSWLKAKKDKHWASRNYLSQRSLTLASNVRQQLATLLEKLHVDCSVSCWPEKEPFLKCLLAGLSLNVAQKVSSIMTQDKKGSNVTSAVGGSGKSFSFSNTNNNNNNANLQAVFANNDPLAPYRTVRGNQPVHIHPSSVLFSMINSKKLPAFVVYADLLTTSKQYMRNVSIVEGDWLTELFPNSFKK